MDSMLLASLILGVAMIVAAVTLAIGLSRGRTARLDASGDTDRARRSRDEAIARERHEPLREAIEALAHRVRRLEESHVEAPSPSGSEPPLSVHPPLPTTPASPAEPTAPASIIEPRPRLRRNRDEMALEIRRLLARGRDSLEIAQMLDIDVGEVELVLQLDRAATGRDRHSDD